MEQNPSLEVNSSWADKVNPRILWNISFIMYLQAPTTATNPAPD
jgi:hypothetical protein